MELHIFTAVEIVLFVNAALNMDAEERTLLGQISPYKCPTKNTLNSKQTLNHDNFCGYW